MSRRAVVVALLLLATPVARAGEPAAAPAMPPGAIDGVTLRIDVADTVWSPGEAVEIRATLSNVGTRPVVIDTFGELNVRYPFPGADTVAVTAWELPSCAANDANRVVAKEQFIRLDPGQRFVKMLSCTVPHNIEPGRDHVWLRYAPLWPDSIAVFDENSPDRRVVYPEFAGLPAWEGFVRSSGVWVDLVAAAEDTPRPRTESDRYYELPEMANNAYWDGDFKTAESLAQELLRKAEVLPRDWAYGNAIHTGHTILGLVALRRGGTEAAKTQLLASIETPGSPQLNSFGPDMSLARELLHAGERGAVIEYLTRWGRFWTSPKRLQYLALVGTGQVPDDWW